MIRQAQPYAVEDFFSAFRNVRSDFPLISQCALGGKHPLVYLDSAATSQKPQVVLDCQQSFYQDTNSNVHRSVNRLGEAATAAYETARTKIRNFIHAEANEEIIFTSSTTAGINLVANSWSQSNLKPGDEILLSEMEHHSNLVPWQLAAARHGARLRFIPILPNGTLDISALKRIWNTNIRLVAVTHVSNVLGTINPVQELISYAHSHQVPVLIDGAQSVPHMPVDVQSMDADFFVFSGHKMCGPTGIGVLYGKKRLLESMPPFLGGGDMISHVSLEKAHWNDLPYKFEAGTPHFEGAVTLGAAVDYLVGLGMNHIHDYEAHLTQFAIREMSAIDGLEIYGPLKQRAGVISFNMKGIHASDLGEFLDSKDIAIRCGHHCAEPLHQKLGLSISARASFYIYNNHADVVHFVDNLKKARKFFHKS